MPAAYRIVVLDHFFSQDITALEEASRARFAWRTIPYWQLRDPANRIFPPDVRHGLAPYARDDLGPARQRYADWLRRWLGRMYVEWPFDVFVLPSDAFYYVRELPDLCHDLGVPVVVVQKETTITNTTFETHAPDVRAHAPFVSDHMTVCSERHRRFWLVAGADGERVEVTGQPRFDVYAADGRELTWNDVGLAEQRPTVLFLSYEIDAYLSNSGAAIGWRKLRDESEQALFRAVETGWRVVVKLHPLQPYDDEAKHLAAVAPGFGEDVVLAPERADTRYLLMLSDVVVGFQSTALLEALALRKPVAYAGWGDLHDDVVQELIPFRELEGLIALPQCPEELTAWLASVPAPPAAPLVERRRRLAEEYLGPFDGLAAERTLKVIAAQADAWGPQRRSSARRRRLDRRVVPAAAASAVRFGSLAGLLRAIGLLARAAGAGRVVRGAEFRQRGADAAFAVACRTLQDRIRHA